MKLLDYQWQGMSVAPKRKQFAVTGIVFKGSFSRLRRPPPPANPYF